MKNKKMISLIILIAILGMFSCSKGNKRPYKGKLYTGKKILFVNSYHDGYAWSDGIVKGAEDLADAADIDFEIFEMDSKRNTSVDFIKKSALRAKKAIEEYKPDIVIVCDDNAAKYLIVPHFKNAKLPFVFCGVNWDASVYGFPFDNVTGMLEVEYINGIIGYMRDHAKGDKIGLISTDVISDRRSAENYKTQLNIKLSKEVYVKTVADWKKEFVKIQNEVDMLIISNVVGIKGWDNDDMQEWMLNNTKIPTGTSNEWVMKYSVMGLIKIPEEHGRWSVKSAMKIFDGASPRSIPIVKSKEGRLFVNTTLAKKLNIKIDDTLMQNAVKVD
ncbi:MAG: ABC transporter substrate-binding protein [bacterium]|nr:ABC transporter substrate-binding protein [bacterium]